MIRRMSPLARLTGRDTRIGLVAENKSDVEPSQDQPKLDQEPFARLASQNGAPEMATDSCKPAPLTLHSPILPERVRRAPQVEQTPLMAEDTNPETMSDLETLNEETEFTPDMSAFSEPSLPSAEMDSMTAGRPFAQPDSLDTAPLITPPPAPEPKMPTAASEPASDEYEAPAADPTPTPARRSSRVKTTFLGFDRSEGHAEDLFDSPANEKASTNAMFPVGWLVVTDGEGRGTSLAIHDGVSQIGRGDDQAIQLDFGDNSISRSNHAAIAFDEETRAFYLGYGGKSNIVRLNGKPVLATETLEDGDMIRIGETTLRFIAFCGPEFSWKQD